MGGRGEGGDVAVRSDTSLARPSERRTRGPEEPSARRPALGRPAEALRWRVTVADRTVEELQRTLSPQGKACLRSPGSVDCALDSHVGNPRSLSWIARSLSYHSGDASRLAPRQKGAVEL